ncbi:hypothetical protein Taro_013060 [Colocasia esculenta]|uniref:Uncharacterized protein n=1 Tax=Colocasia esculenta TaxID=4460 RepID=A0A843UL18_COLES|nr:hypothetical protein [Colocasia esculenta]
MISPPPSLDRGFLVVGDWECENSMLELRPCSDGNAAASEAMIMSQRRARSRRGHDAPERRVESFARCSALEGLSRVRELSWVVWDAEDSLEFYPAQASQSFFSLPHSLRPWNHLERIRVEDKTSVDAPDRD